jgi:Flp pilus assembly protein TadD
VSEPTVQSLHGTAVYNPDLLSKEELIGQFVARHSLLSRLTEDLRAPRPQHKLLVGSRGMGKTTLLRRLRYAIEDDAELNRHWLPLVFPEEQYNVTRLADLYINCIDSLSDLLEERGDTKDSSRLDEFAAGLASEDPEKLTDITREFLLAEISRLDKGLVLLVDNADLILDGLPDQQEWAFRELLSHEARLVMIGATVRPIEAEFKYGKAFHDFFQVHELRGFTEAETRQVLQHLARLDGKKHVEQWLDDAGRLKTLNTLTGGNPRTVVLLYHLLAQGADGTVRTDLERLLDLYTPNYKARFEELPKQAQQVLDALALHWDPATAGDIAKLVRSDVNAVSSQLSRLVKQGIVEQVSYYPGPKSGYQIAERFFNIWYLMRASRRIRRKLQWLVEFLRLFYNQEDLRQQATRHLRLPEGFTAIERLKYAEHCFCLAQAIEGSPMRDALETTAIHSLLEDRSLRKEIGAYIDLDGVDTAYRPIAERMRALTEAHEAILATKITWVDMSAEEFWRLLGSVPSLSAAEKRRLALKLEGMSAEEISELSGRLKKEIAGYSRQLGDKELTESLWEALRQGFMDNLMDVNGAQTVAERTGMPNLVAVALAERLKDTPSITVLNELEGFLPGTKLPYLWLIAAEYGPPLGWRSGRVDQAIEQVKELGQGSADTMSSLGSLLHDLGEYSEALAAHREAARLDPTNAKRWIQVGGVLAYHLGQSEEAEQVYRKAIDLAPKSATVWDAFGDFLRRRPGRQAEAEDAYRRSISLAPKWSEPWFDLGLLLKQGDRNADAEQAFNEALALDPKRQDALEELAYLYLKQPGRESAAEQACRKAISLDPKHARSWGVLGDVIRNQAGRQEEAEQAYRRAISLDAKWAQPWGALGDLIGRQINRRVEAEAAYVNAISLDPKWATAFAQLGVLLSKQKGRESEAEEALRKAISLRQNYAYPWGVLGDLLSGIAGREKEAEESYRRAITLDPKWANPWGKLGDMLSRLPGRESDAEEAYRMTISLNPNPPNPWNALGALLSRQPGREAQAEDAFRRAISLEPNSPQAWAMLGTLIEKQPGREFEAVDAYQQATVLDPGCAPWWNGLAWNLYRAGKGDTVGAEDAARKAVANHSPESSHTLATILVSRRKWLEATEYARKFIVDGTEEFYERQWPEIVAFFRECVKSGYTRESIELLAELDLAERWRPLREALAAIAEGTRDYLRRVAPEVRDPAEKILDKLIPEGWGKTKTRRRKSP